MKKQSKKSVDRSKKNIGNKAIASSRNSKMRRKACFTIAVVFIVICLITLQFLYSYGEKSRRSVCASEQAKIDAVTVDSVNVAWFGDSYSTVYRDQIVDKLSEVYFGDNDSYIKSGRALGRAMSNNVSGLSIIDNLENYNLRYYNVIALGTNDASYGVTKENYMSYIDNIEDALTKKVSEHNDIIMSLYNIDDFDLILVTTNNLKYDVTPVNAAIYEAAEKYDNIFVADWYKASSDRLTEFFADDPTHLHPNQDGYALWLDTIYDALGTAAKNRYIKEDLGLGPKNQNDTNISDLKEVCKDYE